MFNAISSELRRVIDRTATAVTLDRGVMLFSQGEAAESFFILESGEIEISVVSAGGRKLALEIMTPGEFFGEIGLFAGRRSASATAIGPARLRRVRRADLMAALRAEPDLALEFINLLCARLRSVSDRLEERAFLPLPSRLASRILHLDGRVVAQGEAIPISQSDLADFAGATREAVAKILAGWRAGGWVGVTRGAVRVLDRPALEAVAADGAD